MVLDGRFYIAQGIDQLPVSNKFRVFKPDPNIEYCAFCDDFGPMNMSCISKFIRQLDTELAENPSSRLFYCVEDSRRSLTNAVFLLGSYMLLKNKATLDEVAECFSWVDETLAEDYRDATFSDATFRLSFEDCWHGLAKGIRKGWVAPPPAAFDDEMWGKIHMEEYAHYDNPLNGDLHEVVPGKLVAFKGPSDLGGPEYVDDGHGYRRFSPSYYVEIFKELGVRAVVRLNEPEYDGRAFSDGGLGFEDLYFDDCTAPPPQVVGEFLAAVDSAGGPVAVHCRAGLGRTGTLIALYLMRSEGFTAREAMGWLRIMRPGSVIGEQQHYLCAVERDVREGGTDGGGWGTEWWGSNLNACPADRRGAATAACAASAAAAVEQGRQVAAGMARRVARRAGAN